MAHYEPPHQDLRCLQVLLFSSLVVKELRHLFYYNPISMFFLKIKGGILVVLNFLAVTVGLQKHNPLEVDI